MRIEPSEGETSILFEHILVRKRILASLFQGMLLCRRALGFPYLSIPSIPPITTPTSQSFITVFMRLTYFAPALLLLLFCSLTGSPLFAQEAPPPKKKPTPSATSTTPGQSTSTSPKPAPTLVDTLQSYLKRMNVKSEKRQGNNTTLVTHYQSGKDIVDLVLVNMPSKKMLGFYTYKFGNTKKVTNPTPLFKTLLSLNDQLAVGAFFIDEEDDIGFKFSVRTDPQVGFDEFQSVYLSLVSAVKQARPQILKHFEEQPETTQPETDTTEAPPGQESQSKLAAPKPNVRLNSSFPVTRSRRVRGLGI